VENYVCLDTGLQIILKAGLTNSQTNKNKPTSRAKIVVNVRNAEGESVEKQDDPQKPKDTDLEDYAFILKKNVYPKTATVDYDTDPSEIEILSTGLWGLLRESLGWYPYHIFRESPVTLESPFEAIVFQWEELQTVAQQATVDGKDKQAREDLKLLLDTISGGSSGDEKLDKYFKARPNYKKSGTETVQFADLWTVFPPGTLIYGKPFQDEDQVFIVIDNKLTWPQTDRSTGNPAPWRLEAWTYDWNNKSFGRTSFIIEFNPFDGHLPLTSLEYYPFQLHPLYGKIWKGLVERGRTFRRICTVEEGSQLFEYAGNAILEKKGFVGISQDDQVCVKIRHEQGITESETNIIIIDWIDI
jgi:hypothetical protein